MSRRLLSDRRVTIVPVTVTGTDARNNDTTTEGTPIEGVPALRRQVVASEDVLNRDEQLKEFTYFLEPYADDGTVVVISGRDRILDGIEKFEVRGTPEFHTRRRRPHHFEANAFRIEG